MTDNVAAAEPEFKEPPAEKPTKKSPKARPGIGHNSRRRSAASEGPDISAEIFPPSVAAARKAVLELSALTLKLFRAQYTQTAAVGAAIHAALFDLEAAGQTEEFCTINNIVAHGNVKNLYQPRVKCFFRNLTGSYVAQDIWRLSAAQALAAGEGVKRDEYLAWLQARGGLDNVVSLYRDLMKKPNEPTSSRTIEELAESILAQDAPVSPATPVTFTDLIGRRVAAVDVDASGEFKMLRVLPLNRREVDRLLAAVASGKYDPKFDK
jgi:hypothetical protein